MLSHLNAYQSSQQRPAVAKHCTHSHDTRVRYSDPLSRHFEQLSRSSSARIPLTHPREEFPNSHMDGSTHNGKANTHSVSIQLYLEVRLPSLGSFAGELRSKENLRTHNYAIEGKAIDLKCFGSLRHGFALPGADLGLVMTTHGELLQKELEAECPRILNKAFLDAGFGARMIQRTRIPTIKFHVQGSCSSNVRSRKHAPNLEFPASLGIHCDINFSGRLALYNTKLLRCYALCDERVRLIGVFVKMWAKARNTSNPYRGTLCSYGYILMVIHYLTNVIDPPLVPNLQLSSQPCPGHSKIASFSEYNILFINNEAGLERRASYNIKYGNRQSIGKLLRGFFAYYGSRYQMMPPGCFNWVQNVVSIRTQGGIVAKLDKDWNTSRTDEHGHRLRFLVAIEDPFEHNHNVGRKVTDQGLKAITAEFSRARIIIRRVQEIPRVGWEWRTDNGHVDSSATQHPICPRNSPRNTRIFNTLLWLWFQC
ncbi:uncharacterized protein BDW43DRAFT_304033 [Aspergillus alliaceus]|uniref:uncharacterized protein n=1 Tax=Petromyces alliaceus TaxID=209559 RepID=UPI0012A59018|nr:uncharacterized protein BDW43DRAFT_304033 [Aspergillus alliaceus]KAB8228216.1 hypothetical protein BDW43DRAFT_304033 [Aspergillus alliaceus]